MTTASTVRALVRMKLGDMKVTCATLGFKEALPDEMIIELLVAK